MIYGYLSVALMFFLGSTVLSLVSALRYEIILLLAVVFAILSFLSCLPLLKAKALYKVSGLIIMILDFSNIYGALRRLAHILY